MTKLRMIPGGEKFSASDTPTSDPNIWVSVFSFRRDRDAPKYEKRVTWDFSKCSREDLIKLSFYDLRVWVQAQLRNSGDGAIDNPQLFSRVDVVDDKINAARQPVDPEARASRAVNALNAEQRFRLLTSMGVSEAEAKAIVAREAHSASPATGSEDAEVLDADTAE